jgi:sporulation delaying protein A
METDPRTSRAARDATSPPAPRMLPRLQSWALDAVLFACCGLWVVANLSVFVSDSPIDLGYRRRTVVQALSPQGWAFFTRDPRESWEKVFLVRHGRLEPANPADARGMPWRGAIRGTRNRGIVLSHVIQAVPADAWQECKKSVTACWKAYSATPVPVRVEVHDNTGLCGQALLQKQPTLPWAWRRASGRTHMPSRIALVKIDCVEG